MTAELNNKNIVDCKIVLFDPYPIDDIASLSACFLWIFSIKLMIFIFFEGHN